MAALFYITFLSAVAKAVEDQNVLQVNPGNSDGGSGFNPGENSGFDSGMVAATTAPIDDVTTQKGKCCNELIDKLHDLEAEVLSLMDGVDMLGDYTVDAGNIDAGKNDFFK